MCLNDDFSQICGQILLMDPIPSVNLIFSLIIQEERQRSVSVSQMSQSTVAFNVRDTNGSKSVKNNQHKNFKKNQVYCTHCNKSSHTQEKSYRLHGFPPGFKFTNGNNHSRANSVSTDQVNGSSFFGFNDVVTGLSDEQCK